MLSLFAKNGMVNVLNTKESEQFQHNFFLVYTQALTLSFLANFPFVFGETWARSSERGIHRS